jgi:hypothetical protein
MLSDLNLRSRVVIGCAAAIIWALTAAVEIHRGLDEREKAIRSTTAWIESESARAEEMRNLNGGNFTAEIHVGIGQARLRDLQESPRPVIAGLLRSLFDLVFLLPLALVGCYVAAALARHPSRALIGRIVIRLGLPVLGIGVALFVIWLVLVAVTLGPLAVPAG